MSVRHKGFNHVMYFGPPLPPPPIYVLFFTLYGIYVCVIELARKPLYLTR